MRKVCLLAFLLCAFSSVAQAQFNSGSTGADGALDLSTMTCPNNICEVQLPESGILNYTTVNIPQGKELRFKKNLRNTPVILLTQGNVTISGTIQISAPGFITTPLMAGNIPGPGGFYGGQPNRNGFGPGGGTSTNTSGNWVGPLSLSPIVGGSGGYGGASGYGEPGGGGGGAIVIASSASIVLTATASIVAWGGIGDAYNGRGSSGSGGAIRLVGNSLNVAGSFQACAYFGGGRCGVVRLESANLTFTGGSNPAAILSPINPNIGVSAQPLLTIQSVGGYQVPSYAGSRFDTVDLLLPNQLADPVSVVVRGNNIPVGTEVRVGFVSGSPNGTSAPCSLTGTEASSQCTATISNLNRTGVTYLLATATFAPPASLAKNNLKGKNRIARVRLESVLGAKPKHVFLRADNSVIDQARVPKEFLQHFGM